MCPPERPRSGVSIPRTHTLCAGIERWMRPCGATRAGTQAPPLPNSTKPCGVPLSHHIVHSIAHANRTVCPYPPYCTFDSSKPCGVPLPHRGYTFDSAGLTSATQPTLGNGAREEATPLGVVLFPPHCFLMSPTHNTSGAEMHRALPPPFFKTSCVCKPASR